MRTEAPSTSMKTSRCFTPHVGVGGMDLWVEFGHCILLFSVVRFCIDGGVQTVLLVWHHVLEALLAEWMAMMVG